jgi:hypothetical protein
VTDVSSIFNKREAFRKCAETKEFKAWHRVETLRRLGQLKDIERIVDEQMQDKNLKIENIQKKG